MKKFSLVIILLSLAWNSSILKAQEFSLAGQFIPRTEYRHGYKSLANKDQDYALFTQQRTRLIANYNSEKVKTRLSIQDIRTWGNTSQLKKVDGLISVHEAWAEINLINKLWLRAGRQELAYDDHRILGSVDWAPQARSHDLALLKFMDSIINVHLGLAYNQNGEALTTNVYTIAKNYKAMQFLWLNKQIKSLTASVLFLNHGLQAVDSSSRNLDYKIRYSQTLGTRLSLKKGKFKGNAAYYYQFGKNVNNQDIGAFNALLELAYTPKPVFTILGGFEYLSGTSQIDTKNKTDNSFNPFYGTNHKFNGFIDYFYVGNHVGNVGLQDIYLKFKVKKNQNKGGIDLHFFSSGADILDVKELGNSGDIKAMNSYLGTEVDVYFSRKITNNVLIVAGYSQMFGTNSMEAIKKGDKTQTNNWAFLMLKITPTFFTKKVNN